MHAKPTRLLFLSTGNAARSIMAEALLNHKGSESFLAFSAGTSPLPQVDPETLALLREKNFETESLHPKDWTFFQTSPEVTAPDVVITLSEQAREICKPWPHPPVMVHWQIDDPLHALRPDVREWKFRKCFAILDRRLTALVRERPAVTHDQLFLRLKALAMVV